MDGVEIRVQGLVYCVDCCLDLLPRHNTFSGQIAALRLKGYGVLCVKVRVIQIRFMH